MAIAGGDAGPHPGAAAKAGDQQARNLRARRVRERDATAAAIRVDAREPRHVRDLAAPRLGYAARAPAEHDADRTLEQGPAAHVRPWSARGRACAAPR